MCRISVALRERMSANRLKLLADAKKRVHDKKAMQDMACEHEDKVNSEKMPPPKAELAKLAHAGLVVVDAKRSQ